MKRARQLLEKIHDPKAPFVVGGHVFLTDPSISEAFAFFGYDFIWIDGEHGPFDKEKILSHIVYAVEGGSAAFVRVYKNDPDVIKTILDMGVDGIIIPQITTLAEAQLAIASCLYPPKGIRGFGPRRANRFNALSLDNYIKEANSSFLRILQIEHYKAVEIIDAIVDIAGLDSVMIGPMDLSSSMGLLGQPLHPKVLEMGKRVIRAAKKKGIACGVSIGPDRTFIKTWKDLGVDYISCGDDISFLHMGAQQTIKACRD